MKYFEVEFTLTPCSQVAQDLLSALAGEAGFETFEETETGLTGYVQQSLLDESALQQTIDGFPLEDTRITYKVREAEDRDWNEQWEQEGFEPIVIRGRWKVENGKRNEKSGETLVIHDGRHLPTQLSIINCHLSIEIDAHLAFGTGTHETTQMVCATLLDTDLTDKRILDCGCGTGILGITAMKLGARECVGYDIDEWSVDNTRHNAVINNVDVTPLLGDASILNKVEGTFDIVVANINRNILLQDMPAFRQKMATGAKLILSGFYTEDIPLLQEKAARLGLSLTAQKVCNDWACIVLQ
jgi:ribosomal protein L11 methyltransferase